MATLKISGYSVDHGFTATASHENKVIVGDAEAYTIPGIIKGALANVDTAGGVLSIENDTDNDFIIDLSYIDVTTKATAACTLDAGVAANATTSNDTVIDGLDVNAATGIFNNIDNAGTNGGIGVKLASGNFFNISVATGASAGLVGNAYIKLIKV